MQDSDKKQFAELINICAANYGIQIDKPRIKALWGALTELPIHEVESAILAHIKSSKFFPNAADLLEHCQSAMAKHHIGADEAWAIVLESFDESKTVVMTDEILAAKSISQSIWDDGDKIGARMAFKSAYERLSKSASGVKWKISVGYDKEDRVRAINEAVRIGRISPEQGKKYLPDMRDPGPIAGLLTGKVTELPKNSEHLRKRWHELKQAIRDGSSRLEQVEQEKVQAKIEKQEELERKKQEAVEYCNLDKASGEE